MAGMRVYSMGSENQTVSTIVDFWSYKAGATTGAELHYWSLSAGGVTSAAEWRSRLLRYTGTVTQGSGGASGTLNALDSSDSLAAAGTGRFNDTTVTTATATVVLAAWQWNVLMPFEYLPPPEDRVIIKPTEGMALHAPAAGASTLISTTAQFREF